MVFKDESASKKKLELVGQYSLFGSVKSMKSVRLSGNVRDSLLLSFDDAKVLILGMLPLNQDVKLMFSLLQVQLEMIPLLLVKQSLWWKKDTC